MYISGLMVACTMVSGEKIKWRVQEFSLGPTVESTKVSTSMIKRTAKVFLLGLTVKNMMVNGKMDCNMGLECILHLL